MLKSLLDFWENCSCSAPASGQQSFVHNFSPNAPLSTAPSKKKGSASITESTYSSQPPPLTCGVTTKPVPIKSPETVQLLRAALKKHFLFAEFPESLISGFCQKFEFMEIEKGSVVIKQGNEGNHFFIVERGQLGVYVNGEEMSHKINPGDYFGDLALLYDHPRSATVFAISSSILWVLSRDDFRIDLAGYANSTEIVVENLEKLSLFEGLSRDQLQTLVTLMRLSECPEGYEIYKAGDTAGELYLIRTGRVSLTKMKMGKEISLTKHPLKPGDFFGEGNLLHQDQTPRTSTATCTSDAQLWVLNLNGAPTEIISTIATNVRRTFRQRTLATVPMFQSMTPADLDQISGVFKEVYFGANERIITAGEVGESFFIVQSGSVVVTQGEGAQTQILATLSAGDYLGETALVLQVQRTANVISNTPCVLLELSKTNFETYLPESMRMALLKNMRIQQELGERKTVLISDVLLGPEIAHTATSVVRMGKHKTVGEKYAIKIIKKATISAKPKINKIIRCEKEAFQRIESVYVVRYVTQLIGVENNYYLFGLVEGCDLSAAISSLGKKVPVNTAKIWAAMVVCALGAIHDAGVVYRDLKIDNMMVDEKGLIKLCNFGTSAILSQSSKTHSFAGTPEYISPEIILSKGHNHMTDFWSLGIFIFELLTGKTPFSHKPNGQIRARMEIYQAISNEEVRFPDRFPQVAIPLVTGLLSKAVNKRLGSSRGTKDIMGDPFFHGVNWAKLEDGRVEAPFLPRRRRESSQHWESLQ